LRGGPSESSVRANAACTMGRSSCMAGNDRRAGEVDDISANGGLGATANGSSRYTVSGDSGDTSADEEVVSLNHDNRRMP
jgi:hypothetical protein